MNDKTVLEKPSLFGSIVANKCPHCRQGNLFINPNPYNLKHTMQMPEACPHCGQVFELQTGFYFGTGFVSYALTTLFSGITFVCSWFLLGMSFSNNTIWWWLGGNAAILVLLQPIIQRLARSIWIALFVKYDDK